MDSGLLDNLSLIFIAEIVLIVFLLLVIVLTMFQIVSIEDYYSGVFLLPRL